MGLVTKIVDGVAYTAHFFGRAASAVLPSLPSKADTTRSGAQFRDSPLARDLFSPPSGSFVYQF